MVEGLSSGEGPVQNQDGRLTVKIADATYDRVETQTNATDMIGSSITSGGNVVVDAANDIMIEGSTLAAGVGADQTEQTLAVNNPNSGTHQADGVEQSAEYQTGGQTEARALASLAPQNAVVLNAGNNVTIKEATNTYDSETKEVHGTAELSVVVQHQAAEVVKAVVAAEDARKNVKQAKKDLKEYENNLKQLQSSLGQMETDYENGVPGVHYNDLLEMRELVDDVEGDKEWYQAGVVLAAADLTAKITSLAQQTAAAAQSTGTYGFNAGVQLDIEASKSEETINETTSLASNITGDNIHIQTGVGQATAAVTHTTIQGSNLIARDALSINTGSLDVLASRDTLEIDSKSEQASISAQMTVYGASGGASLSGSYSRSKSGENHTTYNNSTLLADNMTLNTTDDMTIRGGNVRADTALNANIGGNLTVESVQNRSRTENNSMGVSGGISLGGTGAKKDTTQGLSDVGGLAGANGGINASNGMSVTKETVRSSLTSGGTANITVGGITQITGATIGTTDDDGNDLSNLNLTTSELRFTDLRDTHVSSQTSGSISTSVSISGGGEKDPLAKDGKGREMDINTTNITYSNASEYDASNAMATLGTGNITVGGVALEQDGELTDAGAAEGSALAGLNRDTTNTTNELWSIDRQEGDVDLQVDHRMLSEEGRKEIKEDFKRTEILGEAIVDMKENSVSFLGAGEGESSLREHIGNTQDFFTATKNFASNPGNKEHIDVITSGIASPEQKDAAYSALANDIARQLGVDPVKAMTLVQEHYNLGTATYEGTDIHQLVQGAYTQRPDNKDGEGNGIIFMVDDNIGNTADAVGVVGHEMVHHMDANRDPNAPDTQAYHDNRENYAGIMGDATVDYVGFNFASTGYSALGNANTHTDNRNATTGELNQTVRNNNTFFNSLDQSEVEYRNLEIPEIHYVRDAGRVDRFAEFVESQTGQTMSPEQAQATLLQGAAGLMDQEWQKIHGTNALVADFLMGEVAQDMQGVMEEAGQGMVSELGVERTLLNSDLTFTDSQTGERRLLFSLGEGEFENDRQGVVPFMSDQTIGLIDELGVPKTDEQRWIDRQIGRSAGQEAAVDNAGGVIVDGVVGLATGAWNFATSPVDTITGAMDELKEADAYGNMLGFQGRDYDLGYMQGYSDGAIAIGAVTSPMAEALGTSFLRGALARASGGSANITTDINGQVSGFEIHQPYNFTSKLHSIESPIVPEGNYSLIGDPANTYRSTDTKLRADLNHPQQTGSFVREPGEIPNSTGGNELPLSLHNDAERGGSWLVTEDQYDLYVDGQRMVGRSDGQFMSPSKDMNAIINETGGDTYKLSQRLETDWAPDEKLIRVDVESPTDFNSRLPDESMSGANDKFVPGGQTGGGVREFVTDPIPSERVWATPVSDHGVSPKPTSPKVDEGSINGAPPLSLDRKLEPVGVGVTGDDVDAKSAGSYRPDRKLPRDKLGNPVPDSDGPHTQLGTKKGRNSDYTQAREFDGNGKLVRDIDFTDHGRPQNHPNPHQHDWVPNPTGGTPQHGPTKPLEMP